AIGDRTRFPARPRDCLRAATADRHPLPRRAEPHVAGRADQPLSYDQAARPAVSIETEIAREVGGLQPAQRPAVTLKSAEFRRTRQQSWVDLERRIVITARKGVRALTPDELQRMPQLYRSALSSLSVARAIALDRNLLLYLESLSLRAYLALYSP